MTAVSADLAARRGWQQDGMIVLLDLLASTTATDTPPIPWAVLTVGALLGRAGHPDQVAAWAKHLDTRAVRTPCADGTTALRCDAVWRAVPVTVVCA